MDYGLSPNFAFNTSKFKQININFYTFWIHQKTSGAMMISGEKKFNSLNFKAKFGDHALR